MSTDEEGRAPVLPGFTVAVDDTGDFAIRTDEIPVTGKDGYGQPTPTVREFIAILSALPEQAQDLPVSRYCDEGVAGIKYELHYYREEWDSWTPHVALW